MKKVFYIPDEYKDLNRDELVQAFIGTYYELIIAIDSDELFDTLYRYLYNSTKQLECSNELLWKYLWVFEFGFMANKMKYTYFADCISKIIIRLPEIDDQKFEAVLRVCNTTIECITGRGPMNEPRLFNDLYHAHFEKECSFLNEKKKEIAAIAEKHKDLFVFKCKNLNVNPYFNLNDFVLNTLIMLHLGKSGNSVSVAECLLSVLDVEDTKELLVIANELAEFFTKPE
jgi:hypothetical protein